MSNPLSEDYLRWLEPQTRDEQGNSDDTYWDLLSIMYEKEFVAFVDHDDNRMVDGLDLRVEFCHFRHIRPDALSDLGPCSFLEVLIGLSRRLAFMAGGSAPMWAWQLISNLKLHKMSDPLSRYKARRADEIMDICIRRNYQPDGTGGFFPLGWPQEDQRDVELWYQMAAYIDEMHPEH